VWLGNTPLTSANFAGELGHKYTFVVTATDRVSNTGQVTTTTYAVQATKYYYLGSSRVAMRRSTATGSEVTYLHVDHLGTVSVATNASAQVLARTLNLPYGGVRWASGVMPTDYGFTGQKDTGLGLVYLHARYYSGWVGRFISADTVVPELGNPPSLNRFSYVRNNPVKYTDPTGHKEDDGCSTEGCNLLRTDKEKNIRDAEYVRKYNFYRACEKHGGPGCPNVGEILAFTAAGFAATGLLSAAPEGIGLVLDKISPAAIGAASSVTAAACADGRCENEVEAAGVTAQQAWAMLKQFVQQRQDWTDTQRWQFIAKFADQMYTALQWEVPTGLNHIGITVGNTSVGYFISWWNKGDILSMASRAVASSGINQGQLLELIDTLANTIH
jgi:RHS repeat-associated protein